MRGFLSGILFALLVQCLFFTVIPLNEQATEPGTTISDYVDFTPDVGDDQPEDSSSKGETAEVSLVLLGLRIFFLDRFEATGFFLEHLLKPIPYSEEPFIPPSR